MRGAIVGAVVTSGLGLAGLLLTGFATGELRFLGLGLGLLVLKGLWLIWLGFICSTKTNARHPIHGPPETGDDVVDS